jgi:hypothetical protein
MKFPYSGPFFVLTLRNYVSVPGNTQEADLLLVDGTYGKVLKRQHVTAYSHSYERPAPYTPSYVAAYAGEGNCDYTAGY